MNSFIHIKSEEKERISIKNGSIGNKQIVLYKKNGMERVVLEITMSQYFDLKDHFEPRIEFQFIIIENNLSKFFCKFL